MAPPPPSPPVPKPRARYQRDSLSSAHSDQRDGLSSAHSADRNVRHENQVHPSRDEEAPPPGVNSPWAPPPSAPPPWAPTPWAPPPSLNSLTDGIAAHIPLLAGSAPCAPAAHAGSAPCAPAANTGVANLDAIISSLANIPFISGMVSTVANPATSHAPSSSHAPSDQPGITGPGNCPTDLGALSQLVMSSLDLSAEAAGVTPPPPGVTPPPQGVTPPPQGVTPPPEDPYLAVLSYWDGEEADSESSNEEECGVGPAPSAADPTSNTAPMTPTCPPGGRVLPTRPAPPPPQSTGQSEKRLKQKTPRAATIRVSRKKGGGGRGPAPQGPAPQGAVVRSSWLDVWKGFRHSVLWATMDGHTMALWKKRTDRFSELLFHVSNITNVKKLDKGRFSVYFRKKHYDFMAHSAEVQDGWVTSLLASRGLPSPAPPTLHGPISIKEPRSRAYGAVWGHDLWLYPNKDGFQLGVASCSVPLNLATVKVAGKHSFTLITPFKSFSLSVDSSKDLSVWLSCLSSSISSALSCSQVALRVLENPSNKVCADCGSAQPEWASANLLLVICQECAGHHRALGSSLSKVRSLKMDNKVWTEPLIQLFVSHGNQLANQVWAAAVPAAEQLLPHLSLREGSKFIQDKYSRGRYRRAHPLAPSLPLMEQRLREVVCTNNIEETYSLICSGAKVRQTELVGPAPLLLAQRAGLALQSELLRLNQYTEIQPPQDSSANRRADSAPDSAPSSEEEELHGKLEDDRFFFSVENDSATCDVLDLREVQALFLSHGDAHEFQMLTLSDQLICAADDHEALMTHLVHILKVILPGGVSYAEVGGASAVSKVCVAEVGGAPAEVGGASAEVGGASAEVGGASAWLLLWDDGVSLHHVNRRAQEPLRMELSALSHHEMSPFERSVTLVTAHRSLSVRFEQRRTCESWFSHLQRALTNQSAAPRSLYPPLHKVSRGSVPEPLQRCISHITAHGLKVEGVYRRCGLASKVNRLVEALMTSPSSALLENDEQGVLDASSALKQYVRQQDGLIPDLRPWMQAAVVSDQRSRFKSYQLLLRRLPDDNRATLSALFAHFYMVQVFSQVNKMSAQNLALVLVPSLFHTLNQDLLTLTREFIIHHTLLFLTPEEEEEQITVF